MHLNLQTSQLAQDLRRIIPSLGSRKKILNLPCFLVILINIRNKNMKSWIHLAFPSLSKPRNTEDAISANPKPDLCSGPPHLTTIKALQMTKVANLERLSLSLVLNRRLTLSEFRKQIYILSSWGTISFHWSRKSDLLTIGPLICSMWLS